VRAVFVRFGGILFVAALAIWLYAVLDAVSSDRTQVRALPKGLWVAIVLLTFVVGAVAWLVYGRPRASSTRRPTLGSSGRTAWPARPGRGDTGPANGLFGRGSSRPAPDDDPEFLAGLDRRAAAQEHEKLLGSWEEELRRREEQLRRDRNEDGPDGSVPPA
jgi:Phospholipase_D-nuclease N-terminal